MSKINKPFSVTELSELSSVKIDRNNNFLTQWHRRGSQKTDGDRQRKTNDRGKSFGLGDCDYKFRARIPGKRVKS